MRKIPLISKDYAEHWSEEPRSQQYQNFLSNCRNSFSQTKKYFCPSEIFEPLHGDSFLIQKYNEKYKQMYIQSWIDIQKKFEACLRRNNPLRDNIVDCWTNEIVVIDFLKDELFYSDRWEMFKIEYEELLKTSDSSIKDNLMEKIQIIPISQSEKIKAVEFKYLGWKSMVRDWIKYNNSDMPDYARMTKKEWLESEHILESEFTLAERYVRKIQKKII